MPIFLHLQATCNPSDCGGHRPRPFERWVEAARFLLRSTRDRRDPARISEWYRSGDRPPISSARASASSRACNGSMSYIGSRANYAPTISSPRRRASWPRSTTTSALGFVDSLRKEIAHKLDLPLEIFSLDRFSVHGCGPVGLHDDFFRFPYVYFVIVVAHSGRLGLIDETSRAARHEPGDIILLDPRRKHGLVSRGIDRRGARLRKHAQSGA